MCILPTRTARSTSLFSYYFNGLGSTKLQRWLTRPWALTPVALQNPKPRSTPVYLVCAGCMLHSLPSEALQYDWSDLSQSRLMRPWAPNPIALQEPKPRSLRGEQRAPAHSFVTLSKRRSYTTTCTHCPFLIVLRYECSSVVSDVCLLAMGLFLKT